jgi:hypothetical protein
MSGRLEWCFGRCLHLERRGMEARDLVYQLASGKRLHRLLGCPEEMYEVMLQCWDKEHLGCE